MFFFLLGDGDLNVLFLLGDGDLNVFCCVMGI